MKYLAMLLVLMLAGCSDPVRGGNITGKYIKFQNGVFSNATQYYLRLKKSDRTGRVEVTKEAWEQATTGMTWPFEVK